MTSGTRTARMIVWSLCLVALVTFLAACGDDDDAAAESGELTVSDVWSRPTVGTKAEAAPTDSSNGHDHHDSDDDVDHDHHQDGDHSTGVVYMTINNGTDTDDRLLGVSSKVASVAEIHETTTDGGIMRMRMIDGLDIPAGESVNLEPAGLHIMLIDLHQDLAEGETFEVDLEFEHQGTITVTSTVRSQ